MRALGTIFSLLFVLLPAVVSGQAQANCTFLTFSAPSGYTLLDVDGITNSGVIVGSLENKSTLHQSGFIRDATGHLTIYNAPGSLYTRFTGRNDSAVDVGIYQDSSTGGTHGFNLAGSHFVEVNYPGAINTYLYGINKSGTMVGVAIAASASNGFELKGGQYSAPQFPGSLHTEANGINDLGTIVGEYDFDGIILHGYILQNGTYQSVDDPDPNNAFGTRLLGINTAGTVVGEYEDSNDFFHGFLYKDGVFQNVVYPGSRNTFVNGINNTGLIAGLAYFADGSNLGYVASCQ